MFSYGVLLVEVSCICKIFLQILISYFSFNIFAHCVLFGLFGLIFLFPSLRGFLHLPQFLCLNAYSFHYLMGFLVAVFVHIFVLISMVLFFLHR